MLKLDLVCSPLTRDEIYTGVVLEEEDDMLRNRAQTIVLCKTLIFSSSEIIAFSHILRIRMVPIVCF